MNGEFTETFKKRTLRYSLHGMPALTVSFQGKDTESLTGDVCMTGSTHGSRIDLIDMDYVLAEKPIDRPDGFITQLHNAKLVARVADCATVLLVHAKSGTIGLAHAGWRGTQAGVVQSLVAEMSEKFQIDPVEIQALVTPYADGDKYEVHVKDVEGKVNVYAEFARVFPKNVLDVIFIPHESDTNKAYLDAGLAVQYALMTSGIAEENITISVYRTMSDDRLWSLRVQNCSPFKHNIMCAYLFDK